MVDIANTDNKKDMNQADLDAVVQEVSNERETVEPNQQLYPQEEHGFIVEQNGRWQMRVSLFTLWLKGRRKVFLQN